MSEQMIFKRYEIKYIINNLQAELLRNIMSEHMIADPHGKSAILSLYFDTPDYLLTRRSMDHPMYKEKIRLRSYGIANSESTVFMELKKKYDSVVYKRRISMSKSDADYYISTGKAPDDSQITREIDYSLKRYEHIAPSILLSYNREAFYAKDDHEFRITLDRDVLWRNTDLNLSSGIYGSPLINNNQVLMEVKTGSSIPLWLVDFLSSNHIYKTSFSKCGSAYKVIKNNINKGILRYA